MKTLIILKSLAKNEKLAWVKNEELENYFLDINIIRKMYSCPELISPDREILGKAFGDLVYKRFLEVLITRLGKGCLIVLDPENEACGIFETLALIFGYTVFYVVGDIPQDYIGKPKKYQPPYYPTKKREDLEREVQNFLNLQLHDKRQIRTYQDVENYWSKQVYDTQTFKVKDSDKILHVSDLHSNFSLYNRLPNFSDYRMIVFHGDYIDGPEIGGSRKLIDIALENQKNNIVWLEGNHELRLRKYLGWKLLVGGGKKEIQDLLYNSLPDEFLGTTAKEFEDLGPKDAKIYLEGMNVTFKMFSIIKSQTSTYYCTHGGIRFLEQLSPKFIGNIMYGSRDINRHDKDFADRNKRKTIYSVHAHCKYPDKWEPQRYSTVINIDPHDENEIIYAEQQYNKWNICLLEKLESNSVKEN